MNPLGACSWGLPPSFPSGADSWRSRFVLSFCSFASHLLYQNCTGNCHQRHSSGTFMKSSPDFVLCDRSGHRTHLTTSSFLKHLGFQDRKLSGFFFCTSDSPFSTSLLKFLDFSPGLLFSSLHILSPLILLMPLASNTIYRSVIPKFPPLP